MQDALESPRHRSKTSPRRTSFALLSRAALALSVFLAVIFAGRLCRAAEPEVSPESQTQPADTGAESVEMDLRRRQIENLADELLEDMRKDGALATDTLFLKSGIRITCDILSEAVSHYTISYNGLETVFPKSRIVRVETRSRERVEGEMRAAALAEATKIVDCGLVRHGDDWITPDERAYRVMKAQMRSEAKRIEERTQAEIAKAEARAQSARLDEGIRAPITVEGSDRPRMYVEVTLVGKNSSSDVTMLLDTGAAKVFIPPEVVGELELVKVCDVEVRAADGGASFLPLVRLKEISVHGAVVREMDVIVADFNPPYRIGLLGTDFLRHFEFRIDPEQGVLILKSRQE